MIYMRIEKFGNLMKHIKLFENYFEDEEWNRLLPYFTMSQSERDKIFFEEVKKDEPNLQVIEDLLDTQLVDPNVRDKYQRTPLHLAAWKDSLAVAELLLDRGAKIEARDKWQRTPLHWAAYYDSIAVAKLLLDRGADYEARDNEQSTPLHLAALRDSRAVAELLLDRGAKIDARNEYQRTPLHLAAMYDYRAVAELLLNRGAKIDARDEDQSTPWDLADEEIQEALPQLKP